MNFKILDCTLRDGGYYNNWDFDDNFTDVFFRNIGSLPIDYVEIGYSNEDRKLYKGKYYYCKRYLTEKIKKLYGINIAIMLDGKLFNIISSKEFNVDPNVDLYRIACDPLKINNILPLVDQIKLKGKKVALNFMYATQWHKNEKIIKKILDVSTIVDFIYVVDSYGSLKPSEVSSIIKRISNSGVSVGFHAHNNLELGFANTLNAIESGAKIIDSTFLGMGRGAGNLKTELILPFFHKENLDYLSLSSILNKVEVLHKKFKWGTNLPYIVSGCNDIPQSDVMNLLQNHLFSYDQIIGSLNQPKSKNYSSIKVNDKKINSIIIGGGTSIVNCLEEIKIFSSHRNCELIFTSSKHLKYFKDFKIKKYLCITGREYKRFKKVCSENKLDEDDLTLIIHDSKIDYFENKNDIHNVCLIEDKLFQNKFIYSATSLALNLSFVLNGEIWIVGYDGHSNNQVHHIENESIFRDFNNLNNKLVSLTNTSYSSLQIMSIFSLV